MSAKAQVINEIAGWTEEQAARALRAAHGEVEGAQLPFSLIGAFHSRRGDLSERASRDEYEPQPFR